MAAGDTAYITIKSTNGNKVVDINGGTTMRTRFSGEYLNGAQLSYIGQNLTVADTLSVNKNVGIGTSSPNFTTALGNGLEVQVDGNLFPIIRMERVGGTTKTNTGWEQNIGSGGSYLITNTNSVTEALSIDTSSNVNVNGGLNVTGTIKQGGATLANTYAPLSTNGTCTMSTNQVWNLFNTSVTPYTCKWTKIGKQYHVIAGVSNFNITAANTATAIRINNDLPNLPSSPYIMSGTCSHYLVSGNVFTGLVGDYTNGDNTVWCSFYPATSGAGYSIYFDFWYE
jgi:hypothetical protein